MTEVQRKRILPHDYLLRYTFVPLVPRCVTPNMLTILRFVLIPFVFVFLGLEMWNIGVPLFLFAAFTDALDGSVARLRNQITEWGSFYDPIADKLLIGAVVLLVVTEHVNPVFAIIIVVVEASIILGGVFYARKGKVICSANFFGKTKMFLQVLGITTLLIALWGGLNLFIPFSIGVLSLAMIFAVISLFTYGF